MTASFSSDSRVLPLLPLRDVVVFPHMVIPLFVGRPKSIKALEAAMEEGKNVVLVAQKSAAKDEPNPEDLYDVGTVSTILQMLKLPDGTVKVLVEGVQRAHIERVLTDKANFEAEIELIATEEPGLERGRGDAPHAARAVRPVREAEQEDPAGGAHLALRHRRRRAPVGHHRRAPAAQARAEAADPRDVPRRRRLEQLLQLLETEIDIMQVEKRIRGRVKRQMEKSQREYYLNEQVKAIQKELGDSEEGADLDELEKKIKSAHMPKEARVKARRS
jgi:ATP-dependent Lon protease